MKWLQGDLRLLYFWGDPPGVRLYHSRSPETSSQTQTTSGRYYRCHLIQNPCPCGAFLCSGRRNRPYIFGAAPQSIAESLGTFVPRFVPPVCLLTEWHKSRLQIDRDPRETKEVKKSKQAKAAKIEAWKQLVAFILQYFGNVGQLSIGGSLPKLFP